MTDKGMSYEKAADVTPESGTTGIICDPGITHGLVFPGTYEFSNDLMFGRVMQNESLCKRLLERILGIEIGKIDYHRTQMEVETGVFSRGVRLDVYVRSEDTVYDVEMQATKESRLAKRCRYYQAKIDSQLIPKGADYDELPNSYVIFLCKEDPFGHKLPVYTIKPSCREDADLRVESDMTWMALNASAWEAEEDAGIRGLLEYVYNGTVAKDDHFIENIDEAVRDANHDEDWVRMIWSVSTVEENAERRVRIAERAARKALAEGKAKGIAEEAAKYNALVTKLAKEGRLEELAAAVEDPTKLDALFAELT